MPSVTAGLEASSKHTYLPVLLEGLQKGSRAEAFPESSGLGKLLRRHEWSWCRAGPPAFIVCDGLVRISKPLIFCAIL